MPRLFGAKRLRHSRRFLARPGRWRQLVIERHGLRSQSRTFGLIVRSRSDRTGGLLFEPVVTFGVALVEVPDGSGRHSGVGGCGVRRCARARSAPSASPAASPSRTLTCRLTL